MSLGYPIIALIYKNQTPNFSYDLPHYQRYQIDLNLL